MAKRIDKFYSRAEKSALLAQIDRLYQAGRERSSVDRTRRPAPGTRLSHCSA
jgi:hypothetical protein